MTHQNKGRGTLVIDRRFPHPIGRIKRASGTRNKQTFRQLDALLTQCATEGRWDVLTGIKRGDLHPLHVLSLARGRRLHTLAEADTLALWVPLAMTWAAERESPSHRRDTAKVFRRLASLPGPTIGDLPQLVTQIRVTWKASAFNHARNYVRGFLRDTLGKDHVLARQVAAVKPRKVEGRKRGRARSREEVAAVVSALGGLTGEMLWTLSATGMRPAEYWRKDGWVVSDDRVTVVSAKKRYGKPITRDLPRWTPLTRPVIAQRTLANRLKKVAPGWVLYDTRRTFARWTEEAGIIETNRKAYLGHGPKTVTDLYTWGELPGQLAEDAAKVQQYVGSMAQRVKLA